MIGRLARIVTSPLTERVIVTLIVINAVILGLETSRSVMEAWGPLLTTFDRAILSIFVVEIILRIIVHRSRFFRDPWSIFDFLVVGVSLVPATETFSVLRALRVLRVLRLVTAVGSLRRVVAGLISALPGMGSVVALLGLIFYVSSVMATKLFGGEFPEWFGSLGASAYTLFEIMTLDSWSTGIARKVMDVFPHAWAFFIPFIIVSAFAALNLFIGVVVSAMQAEHADPREDDAREGAGSPLLVEIGVLRGEIAELRRIIEARGAGGG